MRAPRLGERFQKLAARLLPTASWSASGRDVRSVRPVAAPVRVLRAYPRESAAAIRRPRRRNLPACR